MSFLQNTYSGLVALVFSVAVFAASNAEAQLLEGKLPKIFNRDREDPGRAPINRDTPDIVFTRDFGIPTPYATKIQTVKGHQVAFYISAKTKAPGMRVEFLVRDFPSAGKIISIISNPENRSSAVVTYVADPDSGATMDSFTFAARYPGGKYSTAVGCTIEIKDARAMVEVSPSVEFDKLMVGESAEREFTITNKGNAPFSTTLNLPPPWKLLSPRDGKVVVGPGQQFPVKLGFAPMMGGTSSYDLILNRSDKGTCKITGEAIVPFSISAEEWELKLNPETGRREVDVLVATHSEKPFEVFLRASSRLKTAASQYTVIIPGKENRIKVYLEKDDVMAFDGGLEIKMKAGYKVVTSVFSNTLPSKMEVEVPDQLGHEVINFGKVNAGRSVERGILIKNTGGELMPLEVSISEPFRVLTNTDRQLIPLESMPISIGFFPHKSDRGAADQVLTLRSSHEEIKIRLVGNALRPPGAPRQLPKPAAVKQSVPEPVVTPHSALSSQNNGQADPANAIGSAVTAPPVSVPSPDRLNMASVKKISNVGPSKRTKLSEELTLSPLGILTKSIVERDSAPGLKSAVDFELFKSTAKSLEFGWTAPKGSEVDSFELEVRGQRTNPLTSVIESVWAPYPHVKYERVDRLVKAKVENLMPFTVYEFRVFTIDQNGRSSPPSVSFASKTTRSMDWTYIYAGFGLLFLGLLGWGIVKVIKDRRGEVYQSQYV